MAKVKPQAFTEIEKAISDTLVKSYNKKRNSFIAAVSKKLSQGDIDGALEKVHNDIHMNGVFWQNRKRLRLLSTASMRFGQTRLADSNDLIYDASDDKLMKRHVALMNEQVLDTEKHIKKAGTKAIEAVALDVKATKAEKVRDFVSFMDNTAGSAGENHLRLVSSLHNSRLAQYGFTVEANVRQIQFYAINAILDGRTSDICETMNGKVFPVEYAFEQSISLLATDDPDMLKYLAPWPTGKGNLESLQSMTTGELMSAGWALPPFHPHCRTYIDEAGTQLDVEFSPTETVISPFGEVNAVQPLGEDTAEHTLLDMFGKPLSQVGALDISKVIVDDVDIQEATNIWSFIPNITLLELGDVIKAIRQGELDDFEIMELYGLSFESLAKIKDLL